MVRDGRLADRPTGSVRSHTHASWSAWAATSEISRSRAGSDSALNPAASVAASSGLITCRTTGDSSPRATAGSAGRTGRAARSGIPLAWHILTNLDAWLDSYRRIINAREVRLCRRQRPPSTLREQVRERYATAAITVTSGQGTASCCDDTGGDGSSCCGPTDLEVDDTFGSALYPATDRDSLPVSAVAASLGCGNPIAVAELRAG